MAEQMNHKEKLSKVYFIPARREDGNEALAGKAEKIFLETGLKKQIEKNSFVAMKIHFGEKGNTGYIKPQWLMDIIAQIKNVSSHVFLTDSNTLYVSQRSNSIDHIHLAWEHGFTRENIGIPVIIADGLLGRDGDEIRVNLPQVKTAKISSVFLNSDVLLCLTHFTGHILTGFGGALKNLGMGCASRAGKLEQHSDVHPWVSPKQCTGCGVLVVCKPGAVKFSWDADSARVQEKMSEYACSVWRLYKDKIGFINFLLKMTKDCDCMSTDQPPIVEDIGILGSLDPVAIDKASVDLMIERSGKDLFREGYDVDWSVQLEHGSRIGLGKRDYELIGLT
jgi:uncharacterized Fe-S center protein